jgi:hypothetical protein
VNSQVRAKTGQGRSFQIYMSGYFRDYHYDYWGL